MGITNFLNIIRNNYKDSVRSNFLHYYDNLYIDVNHALYHVLTNSSNENEIITNLKNYLFFIIDKAKPKKRIYFCCDGVAPLAKMLEQRKRRIERNKTDLSMNFTPGTEFMSNLKERMNDFKTFLELILCIEVIFDIKNEGEGEIKIKNYLLKNLDETNLIYSGDSDMVLILLLTKKLDNIYHLVNKNEIISINKLYDIHINKYCKKCNYDFIKTDLVFMFMFLGNDYLPKCKNFNIENYLIKYNNVINLGGLTKYNNGTLKINDMNLVFLNHISSKLNKRNFKYCLEDYNSKKLERYTYGLSWCLDMYNNGLCRDYHYIYDYETPHINLVCMYLSSNNIHKIKSYKSLDYDLCGILLIPEYANKMLNEKQLKISKILYEKHPIIYEEEKCQKCKSSIDKMILYKRKQKSLKKIDDDFKIEMKDEISELDLNNDIDVKNFIENYNQQYKEKINVLKNNFTKHKKTHKKLNYNIIKKINENFLKLL